MHGKKKLRIGDLLVAGRKISEDQLQEALSEQKRTGRKLGQVLVESGVISEDAMLEGLSELLRIPYVKLSGYPFTPETVRVIPEAMARRFRVIALAQDDNGLLVGMSDPTNPFAQDELARTVNRPLRLAVIKDGELARALDGAYRNTSAGA